MGADPNFDPNFLISHRTAALCDELLGEYNNLYMSIKISPKDTPEENLIIEGSGSIKPEWLALFKKYPDRFMMGADHFFTVQGGRPIGPPSFDETWTIIKQLPTDIAEKIGSENAKTIFNLKV